MNDLYIVHDDYSTEKIGVVDDFAHVAKIEPDIAYYDDANDPISSKATELSFTATYDRTTYQRLHDILSAIPRPMMKRNQKNKENFSKYIKATTNRRTKNGSRFQRI